MFTTEEPYFLTVNLDLLLFAVGIVTTFVLGALNLTKPDTTLKESAADCVGIAGLCAVRL